MNLTSSSSPTERDKKSVSSQSNKINGWLTKNHKENSTSTSKSGNKKPNNISDLSNTKSRMATNTHKRETDNKATEKQLDDEILQPANSKQSEKDNEEKWKNLTALGESGNKKTMKEGSAKVKKSNDFKENMKNYITPSSKGSTNKKVKSAYNNASNVTPRKEKCVKENTAAKEYRRIKPPKSPKPIGSKSSRKLYEIDMWQGSSITSWLTPKEKCRPLSGINSTMQNKDTNQYEEHIGNSLDRDIKDKALLDRNSTKRKKNTNADTKQIKCNLHKSDDIPKNGKNFEMTINSRKRKAKQTNEETDNCIGSLVKQRDDSENKKIQSNTLSNWLNKDTGSNLKNETDKKQERIENTDMGGESHTNVRNNRSNKKIDGKVDKKRNSSRSFSKDNCAGKLPAWQQRLDSMISASLKDADIYKQRKAKLKSQASSNLEFSSIEMFKKPITNKSSEFFKKYGVCIPSVEEILKEQKDFEKYKSQIESFKAMEDFELPFSVKDLQVTQENVKAVLGCSHFSLKDLDEAFERNRTYVSDIFNGKKYSERHEKFFHNNHNKCYNLSIKDLTYSTSMIVFSYEQKEHLITLLKDNFDPDDKRTSYFFQVLLPELCLKLFMDAHDMTYDEAVNYLDTRPIVDD